MKPLWMLGVLVTAFLIGCSSSRPVESPAAESLAVESPAVEPLLGAELRIARPTDNLEPVVAFYRDALGFELLGSFEDHDGFDGVMLGHPEAGYHLELTHQQGHTVGRAPNPEHLLIFYLPDPDAWQAIVDRIESHGHKPVKPNNPYWETRAATFEDPDGYRVVLAKMSWGS